MKPLWRRSPLNLYVRAGQFELVSPTGGPTVIAVGGTFTQAQLDAGEIRFVHDDSEDAPSYTFSVSDGTGGTATSNGNVIFENINDAPTFTANSFSLTEGGILTLTTAHINATDPESLDNALLFTINSVTGGRFEKLDNPGATPITVTTFTLEDIVLGKIRFTQPPADEETTPTYTISVTDTGLVNPPFPTSPPLTTGPVSGTINFTRVNDAPTIVTNTLNIAEGGTALFGDGSGSTGGVLSSTDPETATGQLIYTVSNVVGGQFEFTSNPSPNIGNLDPTKAITTFTQADITAQRVRFVQNGTSVKPNYTVTVADSSNPAVALTATGTPTVAFTDVNDLPTITRNSLTIAEGATVVLGSADLQYSDEESSPDQVTYRVTDASGNTTDSLGNPITPQGGRFELVANQGTAIFRFTQAQVNAGAVQFVHDGTETVPSYYLTLTDSGSVSGTVIQPALTTAPRLVSPAFTRFNDAPTITTNALTITEAGFVILNAPPAPNGDVFTLAANDEETPVANLTYVVDAVTNGYFALTTAPTTAISSFTQTQINNGEVRFVHAPVNDEDPPTYTLRARDSEGKLSDPSNGSVANGNVTFRPVNDAPSFLFSSVSVREGATVILGISNLNATDPDHPDDQIRYSVTNVVGGTVFLGGTALAAWNPATPLDPASTFTAVDLALNRVTFVDDGNSIPPTFNFVAVDPAGAATTIAATVSFTAVNDAPQLTVNKFPITEGQDLVLNNTHLLATDEETTDPTRLVYRVRNISGGRFLTIPEGDEVTQFTQAQINQGNTIYFRHDGTETRPSFTLEVADANGGTTGVIAANIDPYTAINDAPTFTRNVLTIAEGATVTLSTTDNISVGDVDSPLSALDFRIDTLANGVFNLTDGTTVTPLGVGGTFTRNQLALGQVSFTASTSGLTPAYTLIVRDNSPVNPGTATLAANVTFTPTNDAPVIALNNFPITEGQDLTLTTAANLNATDEETTNRSQLVYTVSAVQGGVFFNLGTVSNVTTFTQKDVDDSLIRFRHNGSETPAAFNLSLSDSTGGTATAVGDVVYTTRNDAPVLSVNNFPITEGGTLKLSSTNLSVTDPDNTPTQLRYTMSSIVGGQFSRDTDFNGTPDQPGITTFTQQDVLDGVIFFIHDGSETVPGFSIVLTDTQATLPAVAANVAFTRVNDPPQSVLLSLNVSTINESGSITLNGTFVDVDSSVHTVTIDWGNGTTTTIPSSQIVNNGGGNFSLPTINRVYPDDGVFTITATVNDGQATAQGTATITVNDVLPIVPLSGSGPVEADALYTLTIGTPIDPGADQYVAFRVNWGDGTTTTVNSPGNVNKVYKVFGNYTISVTAIDDAGREFGGFTQTANILYPITDFAGDRLTDFLWRNTTSGVSSMWFLDGSGNIAATPLVGNVDTNFQIQAVADFNNDGKSDILWRNGITGLTSIWFMNGASPTRFEILFTVPDTNWAIIDVTDINNDGSQDLLWRNKQTGDNAFWLLQNGVLASFVSIPSAPVEWEIAGLTDFNRDGFDDILWRNTNTGDNTAWVMNGTSFSGQVIDILDVNPSWDIVAVTDLNGDKVEDFIWRNQSLSVPGVWLMGANGALLNTLVLPAIDLAYELRGTTDLNSDNQTDLLWFNPNTGDVFAWTMNGTNVASTINYPFDPAGWQVYV